MTAPLVSTVIPTFNRRELVVRAIDSALAQTWPAQELIVVDDGSTDGTAQMLRERYGERLRCVSQSNGGVSKARNRGMGLATGAYIALLDSDDTWDRTKLEKQVAWLEARPDYGLVLNDVQRVDRHHAPMDVFHRRAVIASDGDALEALLRNPAFVPASALFRRSVLERVGGFDETLRTAEDLEFHLRIAAEFKIGVIEELLTYAMRGHDGLSSADHTDSDYVGVMERFLISHRERISPEARRSALFVTYERNARSAMSSGRVARGFAHALKGVRFARSAHEAAALAGAVGLGARVIAVRALRPLRARAT